MKFSVTVTLKKDVLDPQGKVVQNTLANMGMDKLKSIRQGKHFAITCHPELMHETKIHEMCFKSNWWSI